MEQTILEFIKQPWPWYVAGPLIAIVLYLFLFFGKNFGISSTYRTVCAIGGGGKFSEFFKFDWRQQTWNLVFVGGAIIGGFIARFFLTDDPGVQISAATIQELQSYGLSNPGEEYLPVSIFSWENLLTWQGLIFIVLGGFLIGFGTRYAGGCTSGHAISGLSDLQLPSLIAVIGFFIGGLFITHLILPYLI